MKSEEFRKMIASKGHTTRKVRQSLEHSLQKSCVEWFRKKYPMHSMRLFAVPNGQRRDATIGRKLKEEGVLAGVCDLILLYKNQQYGALLIEMKTSRGSQSDAQKTWEKAITADNNYKYVVCHCFEDFVKEINLYLCDYKEYA